LLMEVDIWRAPFLVGLVCTQWVPIVKRGARGSVAPCGTLLAMSRDKDALHVRIGEEGMKLLKEAAEHNARRRGVVNNFSDWVRETLTREAKAELKRKGD
jgi:hypothetical protein